MDRSPKGAKYDAALTAVDPPPPGSGAIAGRMRPGKWQLR